MISGRRNQFIKLTKQFCHYADVHNNRYLINFSVTHTLFIGYVYIEPTQ